MLSPLPDLQKEQVILVDPSIWSRYRRGSSDLRLVYGDLIAALHSLGIEPTILREEANPLDIWIRDWGFAEGAYFKFAPSYAKGLYSQAAIVKARLELDRVTGQSHRSLPLVLDGGNLVHNGHTAILTEKVLTDNSHLSRLEVERAICSLGFSRVVFIPVEPNDVVGHADGIVRFVSPDTLLVNDYSGTDLDDYGKELRVTLKRAKIDIELVPFPWFTTGEMNDGVWSAEGCYINFLPTAKGIVLPTFQHRHDEMAAQVISVHTALPIHRVEATPLARLGGALHCISLTM